MLAIDRGTSDLTDKAVELFDGLRQLSFDGVGISRDSFGPGENAAFDYVEQAARAAGLETWRDAGQNLLMGLPDAAPGPVLLCGSHLDSVPRGGNFDGAAGVIAGLLCLMRMKASGRQLSQPVQVMAIRGEESAWFGKALVGSNLLMGKLSMEDMQATHRTTGQTLEAAMRALGIDLSAAEAGRPLLDPAGIAGYLELHIEQGPVMVARNLPTAAVTGIRGNIRHKQILCHGEAGHSGAVPRWLRRDAVFAVAELIHRLDEHWRALLERGLDLVVTSGIIGTNPDEHSMSRIPGEVGFSLEMRSQSRDTLEAFYHLVRTECDRIAADRKVGFRFDRRIDSEPARMDEKWIRRLLELSERLGLPTETVPSGAGHDAAVFANAGIPSAMIFIRNEHGSHNPHEAMDIADFMAGVDLLHQALLNPV